MAIVKKRYRLKLNSLEKIEELLQELYNESDKNIVEIQNQMNKCAQALADAQEKLNSTQINLNNAKNNLKAFNKRIP